MTREQKALFLAVMNRCLGDKMVELEVTRLKRGLPLRYQHHIDLRKMDVDSPAVFTPEEAQEAIAYFAENYHKGHAFLSQVKKDTVPKKAMFLKAIEILDFVIPGASDENRRRS
jgi:hypothetical protein